MKYALLLFLLGGMCLGAADIVIHRPSLQFIGSRIVNRRQSAPGSGVVRTEKVKEWGYRVIFAVQNKGGTEVKLATGFTHITFNSEPEKNLFVLRLSHRIVKIKSPSGDTFPVIPPLESFRVVTLRKGEGTLLNVTCWVPEGKLREGDKFAVEYAPVNFKRFDFEQLRLRSEAVELKLRSTAKQAAPVMI